MELGRVHKSTIAILMLLLGRITRLAYNNSCLFLKAYRTFELFSLFPTRTPERSALLHTCDPSSHEVEAGLWATSCFSYSVRPLFKRTTNSVWSKEVQLKCSHSPRSRGQASAAGLHVQLTTHPFTLPASDRGVSRVLYPSLL